MSQNSDSRACIGCGAAISAGADRHLYVGASLACWASYGRALERVRRLAGPEAGRAYRLLLDAYAVSHPGERCDVGAQSVGVHLVGLAVQLERGGTPAVAADALALAVRAAATFEWLEPPTELGVAEAWHSVQRSLDGEDASVADALERWAQAVWAAWNPHHSAIRRRVDALLRQRAAS